MFCLAAMAGLIITTHARAAVTLQNGVTLRNLGDVTAAQAFYRIAVPPGATVLTVKLSGGRGDADLYLKYGGEPSYSDFDKFSINTGNRETVSYLMPPAGDWFVMVDAVSGYSGATLTARFTMGPGTVAPPVILPVEGIFPGKAVIRFRSRT